MILYDSAIPCVAETFAKHAPCEPYLSGELTRDQLMRAKVLLVRSVTTVDRHLLEGTSIQCVGSMTAGSDHIHSDDLEALGIAWFHAPGANARAVSEHVASVLAYLREHSFVALRPRVAVIGCGEVGSRVCDLLAIMGCDTVAYDPPKASRDSSFKSASWSAVLGSDLLCCCVPLTESGSWPTKHMINASVLSDLNKHTVVINVGRGEVLDEVAFLSQDKVRWCSDVWANEPSINPDMVSRALLASPHVAGYSKQAKANLTWQVYEAMSAHFGWECCAGKPMHIIKGIDPTDDRQLLEAYDPSVMSRLMKHAYKRVDPCVFRQLRSEYVYRDQWGE